MKDDFAALNDRRWRAMTNDKTAMRADGVRHLSCARQSAVICHRAPLAFHATQTACQHYGPLK
ncbi:MAG: hypothetical protein Q4G71_00690 [Pseudomonadota bacterium]|nr:hypothetical protein [Pseudomonadota bacterium]